MKSVHLAAPQDATKLLPLVVTFQQEMGFDPIEEQVESAVLPLLNGSPHGAIWLIGPRMSPVGYICISFGWSLELGGMDGMVDEFFIRRAVRGRGMGTEALQALMHALQGSGLRALSLEVDRMDENAQSVYRRTGFEMRDRYAMMTRAF